MRRADSLEKTLMLGGIGGRRKRGRQRMRWLDGITDSMDWVWVNSGSWWWTGRPGVLRFMGSQRVGHDWATELIWTEATLHAHLQRVLLCSTSEKVSWRQGKCWHRVKTLAPSQWPATSGLRGGAVHSIFPQRRQVRIQELVYYYYWSIIALQFCVSFCCTMQCMSYMYTYFPSFLDLLPLPPTPIPPL